MLLLSFDTFTVVLRVLDESNDTTASDEVNNSETLTAFFTAQSQHDQWMNAFAKGINYAKSQATLKDEKVLLSFAEGMQESSQEIAIGNVSNSNSYQGILAPWQMSESHIRKAANSQMIATVPVDAVLIGYRFRCYSSQEAKATATSISASSQDLTLSVDDQPQSLDIEISVCSSWEAPTIS
ncbi:uncharacterized protein PHALS_01005 [Plasmopara halstedii]|uniref:Pleckstrin homology-like domain n=1 Tax=Plasmopara halstedii TaxID=4781 RepID=A0A0P1AVF6_PLAHL|nr:uncharacterized protein PHALS_01005 [Plasmopara halstedii]CEG44657.1 hypothetical protein PHALS_01005 [Plasmopara halstedii]|eukprot:XP_024581026.1 hypothetical protein PHALS_01005 [Plasmopara halstedii]